MEGPAGATPELATYAAPETLPLELDYDIRALLDAAWPGPKENVGAGPLIDPDLHPVYFVLCDGDEVVGYARTIWAWGTHHGRAIKVYGLGGRNHWSSRVTSGSRSAPCSGF